MQRIGPAAALLLTALSAHAQVEVRPTAVVPSAPGVFTLAPAATLAPALTFAPLAPLAAPAPLILPAPALLAAPAASAAPLAAPAAPVAAAPAATPAAMSAALAEFERTDLKTASAGDSRDAGESLMLRVLGQEPSSLAAAPAAPVGNASLSAGAPALGRPGAPGRRDEPKTYLLSNPLRVTARLGPAAVVMHAVGAIAWEVAKFAVAWHATGSLTAAATMSAFEVATSPIMITGRSLADLGQRYWRAKLAVLKELAREPGVARIKVLTTGEVTFKGPLARQKDNVGFIFVESQGELPETMGRFGAPIPLGDTASTRVRLSLVHGDETAPTTWTPTLKELLDGKPIPPEIAAAWRKESNAGKPALKKMIDIAQKKTRLEAALIGPGGEERPVGAIAEGPPALYLIGLGPLDRVRAFLGRERKPRAIPLSDSVVERPGDGRETGVLVALRRFWRRLTGGLIVAKAVPAETVPAKAAPRTFDLDQLEFEQARTAAGILLREHPAAANYFVGVGRSPAILIAMLQNAGPDLARNLPLSDFYHHPEGAALYFDPLSAEAEARLFDHLERFLPADVLRGERALVLLDWIKSGRSMIAFDEYLKIFARKRHPALKWEFVGLANDEPHSGLDQAGRSYRVIRPSEVAAPGTPAILHARMGFMWHKETASEYGSFAAPFEGSEKLAPNPEFAAWREQLSRRK